MTVFKAPAKTPDFKEIEARILNFWNDSRAFQKLVEKNSDGPRFSFFDGPITANNPMGVHHAWGRSYKDVFQRYKAMQGYRQRFQNGFDCQGLWVEVEVERDLGLNSKREIEEFGLDRFAMECKARVSRFASKITDQSIRLGMWMDWDNSYYTYSDENIEHIWHFLKKCHERGWIRRGGRVMPWCMRCGTSLSQHELVGTDTYHEITHTYVTLRFPIEGRPNEYLLVWTTTPWTLAGNVAAAVHPELKYVKVATSEGVYYLSQSAADEILGKDRKTIAEVPGSDLVGLRYSGPWDELPAQAGVIHTVVPWEDVSEDEGTGIVHIAPGSGADDFELSKQHDLPVVIPIDGEGRYLEGFGTLTGKRVLDSTDFIVQNMKCKGLLVDTGDYTHRYPVCWRCKEEIVFNHVDEWFISSDEIRPRMKSAAETVNWVPESAGKRMRDWLDNMGDWAISRKRYWGLPLPFYECGDAACGHVTVIGSVKELRELAVDPAAVDALPELHRPWIDSVTITCPSCGNVARRVPDVGDCWLDAGVVPFSTLEYMHEDQSASDTAWRSWFPADFITEMREQIRLWFYSMLFMSVTLEDRAPYKNAFVFEKVMDESGEPMHRSFGNAIDFDAAVETLGADVMRWMYIGANPNANVKFGFGPGKEIVRKLLTLWNVYSFFLTYAELDRFDPRQDVPAIADRPALDRWIISRLNSLTTYAQNQYDQFWIYPLISELERFWDDLSNWYVRLSRRRFWKSQADDDKRAAYATLHEVLVTTLKVMAPVAPFISEEMHQNLTPGVEPGKARTIFLDDWPTADPSLMDKDLESEMVVVRSVVSLGRAARSASQTKVRQPLSELVLGLPRLKDRDSIQKHLQIVLHEVNVRAVRFVESGDEILNHSVKPNYRLLGPRFGERIREIEHALDLLDAADVAAAVARGEGVTVSIHGSAESLEPDEIDVRHQGVEGFAVESQAGMVAGIALTLDDDLLLEGSARDLVHGIQNARRNAGFDVSDRITLHLSGEAVSDLLAGYADHIAAEVLAVEVRAASPADGMHTETVALANSEITVGLSRL